MSRPGSLGDLDFDPLQLRRTYARGLEEARARELAYGRIGAPAVQCALDAVLC